MRLHILTCWALGSISLYGGNLLLNPGFENPAIPANTFQVLGTGSTYLDNWKVTGTVCSANCVTPLVTTYSESSNVGTIHFQSHGGNQSLDLTGNGNTVDGGVIQTVNLSTGVTYQLSFWVGNMDNQAANYTGASSIQVFLNGSSRGIFSNNASTANFINWAQSSLTFQATQDINTIEFRNATVGDNEAGLDDVFLDQAPGGVPEPSTSILVALALIALLAHSARSSDTRRANRQLPASSITACRSA